MQTLALILIVIAALFAAARCVTKQYVFSPLTTLTCAVAALPRAPWMAAALAVSAIGDAFLAFKDGRETYYLFGIAGFFLGHALFIVHAASHASMPSAGIWILYAVIAVFYLLYLPLRAMKGVPKLLKPAVCAYALVSFLSFAFAVAAGNLLYTVGIAFLLFSDTLICDSDFAGNLKVKPYILPTYYACHVLAALSLWI